MTRAPFDDRLQAAKAALSAAADRQDAKAAESQSQAPPPPQQPDIYFAAIPFTLNAEGELVAGRASKQPSAGAAEGEAKRLAKTADGAIAFSRSGDAAQGVFQEMVVIRTFGTVPTADPESPQKAKPV